MEPVMRRSRKFRLGMSLVPLFKEGGEGERIGASWIAFGVRIALLDLHLCHGALGNLRGLCETDRSCIAGLEPAPGAIAARPLQIVHVPSLRSRRPDIEPEPRYAFDPIARGRSIDRLGSKNLPVIALASRHSLSHTVHTPKRPLKVVRVVSGCKKRGKKYFKFNALTGNTEAGPYGAGLAAIGVL